METLKLNEIVENKSPAVKRVEKSLQKDSESQRFWLELTEDGQLIHCQGEVRTEVFPRRCFPWSEPLRYFSLRDSKEKEVVLVKELEELDEDSHKALVKTLEEAGFCFIVEELIEVEEEYELRQWLVKTDKGERCFQTRLTDWPREVPGGGLLIQDVHGDIYYVVNPEELPEPGRKKLWAFLD